MKKIVLTTVLFCVLLSLTNSQQVILSAGDIHDGSNYGIAWTLGELATLTLKSDNKIVTQGVIQPSLDLSTGVHDISFGISVNLYPNPTNSLLFIETSTPFDFEAYGLILSVDGKIVKEFRHESMKSSIDVSRLENGFYVLKLQSKNNKIISTYKIIKY